MFRNILIILIIASLIVVDSTDNYGSLDHTIDFGCAQYTTDPPSGSTIYDRFNFRIKLTFNGGPMYISTTPFQGAPNENLLDLVNTNLYILDGQTNIIYGCSNVLPLSDHEIYFYFKDLPLSSNLIFITKTIFRQGVYLLGPRAISIYSSTNTKPPLPILNQYTSFCSKSPIDSNTWMQTTPSSLEISPVQQLIAKLCTNNIDICRNNPSLQFYLTLNFDMNVADGQKDISINSFKWDGTDYIVNNLNISILANDSITNIGLNRGDSYAIQFEGLKEESSMFADPIPQTTSKYPITNSELDRLFQEYNNGIIQNAWYYDNDNLYPLPKNFNYNKLTKERNNNSSFVFQQSQMNVTITTYKGFGVFYKIYDEVLNKSCSAGSMRNPFSNSGNLNVQHYFGSTQIPYLSYTADFSQSTVSRSIEISILGKPYIFNSTNRFNNSDISINLLYDNDNLINIIDNLKDYKILMTSSLFTDISYSLFVPNSYFHSNCGGIGMNPSTFYSQPNFCNQPHGTCMYKGISNLIQSGQFTPDRILENWANFGGYNNKGRPRVIITDDKYMNMQTRFDHVSIDITLNPMKFSYKEAKIEYHGIGNNRTSSKSSSGTGDGCDGIFTIDVTNTGEHSGVFNLEVQCNNPVPLRILNQFQTLSPGQTLPYSIQILFDKYYRQLLECNIRISITRFPLWSNDSKVESRLFVIPQYAECGIVDPCIGVGSVPPLLSTINPSVPPIFRYLETYISELVVTVLIKNPSSSTSVSDYISSIECESNSKVNYFYKDGIITLIDRLSTGALYANHTFIVLAESSSTPNIKLNCTLTTTLYKPSICWDNPNSTISVYRFIQDYPYDPCVQFQSRPTILYPLKYWLKQVDPNNIQLNLTLNQNDEWKPSISNPTILPTQYPKRIEVNSTNHDHVYEDVSISNILYQSNFSLDFSNGGTKSGEFKILLKCPSTIRVVPESQIITLEPTYTGNIKWIFFSYATNLDSPINGCNLSVSIQNPSSCWNDVGILYKQQLNVFPKYEECAGNYYVASLDNYRINDNLYLTPWKRERYLSSSGSVNNVYCRDISLAIGNSDFGQAKVVTELNGFFDSIFKSSCWLNPLSWCSVSYHICHNATQNPDTISTRISLSIENECIGGRFISDHFDITMDSIVDPCIIQNVTVIDLSTPFSDYHISDSDWLSANNDIQGNTSAKTVISNILQFSQSIPIFNSGNGFGIVELSNIQFNYNDTPNVPITLDYNKTIQECNIFENSQCVLWFTFNYNNSIISPPNSSNIIIKLSFNIKDEFYINGNISTRQCIKYSNGSTTVMTKLNVQLPKPLCNSISQPSLLFGTEIYRENPDILKSLRNAFFIYFEEWREITKSFYSNRLSGLIQNNGNGSGFLRLNLTCNNHPVIQPLLVDTRGFTNTSYLLYPNDVLHFQFDLFTHQVEQSLPFHCSIKAYFMQEMCWDYNGTEITQFFIVPFKRNILTTPYTQGSGKDKFNLLAVYILIGCITFAVICTALYVKLNSSKFKKSSTKPKTLLASSSTTTNPPLAEITPLNCICGNPIFHTCKYCESPGNVYCTNELCMNFNLSGSICKLKHNHPYPTEFDPKQHFIKNDFPDIESNNIINQLIEQRILELFFE